MPGILKKPSIEEWVVKHAHSHAKKGYKGLACKKSQSSYTSYKGKKLGRV